MSLFFEIISNTPDVSSITFIVLCLVSFITSAISASFGLGGGTMLVAVFVNILNPLAVIPIHAVIQLNSNFFRALIMWRYIKFNGMIPFIIGSIFGVSIGGQIAFNMPKYLLEGIIGIFILYSLWGPSIKKFNKYSRGTAIGMGIFTSFITMFVGTGSLLAPYIKAITIGKKMTVATHGAYMSWQHGLKIIGFGLLGFTFSPYISLIIGMVLFGILGTWLGKYILSWMHERIFGFGFNLILVILAIKLIYSPVKYWIMS